MLNKINQQSVKTLGPKGNALSLHLDGIDKPIRDRNQTPYGFDGKKRQDTEQSARDDGGKGL